MNFEFSLKNIFYLLFFIGFINLIRDLFNAIKTKIIIREAIGHFTQLHGKIKKREQNIDEHLMFLNKNHKILNSSGLGNLHFRNDSQQSMLSNILINFTEYLNFYYRDELLHSLYSLYSVSVQIDNDFNLLKYIFNFFNPFMYLKKSIPIILNSFYEIFPLKFPSFIKILLESISLFFGILISLKEISPETFAALINFLNNIFNR